jgi:hypothetical protein
MTASEIAAHYAAWAVSKGLLDPHVLAATSAADNIGPIFAGLDQEAAAQILRQAHLADIVCGQEQVIVFHARRLVKRDESALPQKVGPVSIKYQKTVKEAVIDESPAEMAAGIAPAVAHQGRFACGCSIGIGQVIGAGTLGALVRDADGHLYGLTNNHVVGGCNHVASGHPVVAPGPLDMRAGGLDPFCVGHHARSLPFHIGIPGIVPFHLNFDAAIFAIRDEATVSSMQRDAYDTPTKTAPMQAGMQVMKAGRTTGVTAGVIVGKSTLAVPVSYDLKQVGFTGRAYFDQVYLADGLQQPFAQQGDSGSLVVGLLPDNTPAAVGLVFAVAGERTHIMPIEPVLDALGVTLVAGHFT